MPFWTSDVDRNGGRCKLPDALAAAAARRAQLLAATHDSYLRDPSAASRNHYPDSTGFRALAHRVRRVFHIRGSVDRSLFVSYRSTDLEM